MSLEAFENRKTGRFLVERIRIARQRIKDLKSISMKNRRFFFFRKSFEKNSNSNSTIEMIFHRIKTLLSNLETKERSLEYRSFKFFHTRVIVTPIIIYLPLSLDPHASCPNKSAAKQLHFDYLSP